MRVWNPLIGFELDSQREVEWGKLC